MNTDSTTASSALAQQLTMMQLADSFFPSGSYTLSHGLESLVQEKRITSAEAVETFIRLLLCNKVGSTDLVALSHAHRASTSSNIETALESLCKIDRLLFAQTLVEKTRSAQRQSGRALLMVASATWPHPQLSAIGQRSASGQFNCLHPVVFAVVAQIAGLDESTALAAFVHSFVTGLLGAAIRLGALGHLQAQQIRLSLSAEMAAICQDAANTGLDQMWSCTPAIDIAQMRQAKLSRRLFAS